MNATSVISSKGQLVIPAKLRKRLHLQEGTRIVFREEEGRLVLEPENDQRIYALYGSLRDLPLEEDLEEERKAARQRENAR